MRSTHVIRQLENVPRSTVQISKPLIMVVGSSEETRYMLRVVLEIWGYEVLEAESCDESIKLVSERHPSLILLDTTRQFTAELENIRILKGYDPLLDVPAVLMSGFPQETYRNAALANGASGFLVKPIDFDELQKYVETFVGGNQSTTEVDSFRE